MIIYFVVLFIVVIAINRAQKVEGKFEKRTMYFIVFISLVLLGGLRRTSVGTDAFAYARKFDRTKTIGDVFSTSLEPGYFLLCWLGHFLFDNYLVIFSFVAVIISFCFLWGIHKYSVKPELSIFVLLVSGINFFSYNGTRQGLALAFFFLAYITIHRRQLWRFLSLVAIGYFFHSSIIVTLPIYFLLSRKNSLRFNLTLIVIFFSAILFFDELIGFSAQFNERAYAYGAEIEERNGILTLLFLSTLGMIFIYFKKFVPHGYKSQYEFLLNMFLLGLVVGAVGSVQQTNASGIRRMAYYFTLGEVFLWPIVFMSFRNGKSKRDFLIVFVTLYLIYYGLTMQTFGNLVPYRFNPIVLEWFT